jgi:hypothetical protein
MTKSFATTHSAYPNPALRPVAHNKYCVMACSAQPNPVLWPQALKSLQIFFYYTASFHAVAHSVSPNTPQWPVVHN